MDNKIDRDTLAEIEYNTKYSDFVGADVKSCFLNGYNIDEFEYCSDDCAEGVTCTAGNKFYKKYKQYLPQLTFVYYHDVNMSSRGQNVRVFTKDYDTHVELRFLLLFISFDIFGLKLSQRSFYNLHNFIPLFKLDKKYYTHKCTPAEDLGIYNKYKYKFDILIKDERSQIICDLGIFIPEILNLITSFINVNYTIYNTEPVLDESQIFHEQSDLYLQGLDCQNSFGVIKFTKEYIHSKHDKCDYKLSRDYMRMFNKHNKVKNE